MLTEHDPVMADLREFIARSAKDEAASIAVDKKEALLLELTPRQIDADLNSAAEYLGREDAEHGARVQGVLRAAISIAADLLVLADVAKHDRGTP